MRNHIQTCYYSVWSQQILECWYQCFILAFASNSFKTFGAQNEKKRRKRRNNLLGGSQPFCPYHSLFSFHIKENWTTTAQRSTPKNLSSKARKRTRNEAKRKEDFKSIFSLSRCACASVACLFSCIFRPNGCRPGWLSVASSSRFCVQRCRLFLRPRWPRPAWRLDLIYYGS